MSDHEAIPTLPGPEDTDEELVKQVRAYLEEQSRAETDIRVLADKSLGTWLKMNLTQADVSATNPAPQKHPKE